MFAFLFNIHFWSFLCSCIKYLLYDFYNYHICGKKWNFLPWFPFENNMFGYFAVLLFRLFFPACRSAPGRLRAIAPTPERTETIGKTTKAKTTQIGKQKQIRIIHAKAQTKQNQSKTTARKQTKFFSNVCTILIFDTVKSNVLRSLRHDAFCKS